MLLFKPRGSLDEDDDGHGLTVRLMSGGQQHVQVQGAPILHRVLHAQPYLGKAGLEVRFDHVRAIGGDGARRKAVKR